MNNDLLNLVRGTSIPAFITQNLQLTSQHYEAMLLLIDWMLPESEEEE